MQLEDAVNKVAGVTFVSSLQKPYLGDVKIILKIVGLGDFVG